jgi:uncharacterized protein YraI
MKTVAQAVGRLFAGWPPLLVVMTLLVACNPDTPATPAAKAPSTLTTPNSAFVDVATPPAVIAPSPELTPTAAPDALATALASVMPSPQAAATACTPSITTVADVNLRTGPGTLYGILGNLTPNTSARLMARSADGAWLQVTASGGHQGWVLAAYVTAECASDLPVVQPAAPPSVPLAPPTTVPAPPAPTITPQPGIIFWADVLTVAAGQCTVLRWSVTNVASVYFNDGGASTGVDKQGSRTVCPILTSLYQLQVLRNDGVLVQPGLTITVNGAPAPDISFWASSTLIDSGQCVSLYWNVDNVQAVYFNTGSGDQGVIGHASMAQCPASTTTYSLRAVLANGQTAQQYVTVVVVPVAPLEVMPLQPTAATVIPLSLGTATPIPVNAASHAVDARVDLARVAVDQCTTLRWAVKGAATHIVLQREGVVVPIVSVQSPEVSTGSTVICPAQTTALKLIVTWPDGDVQIRDLSVQVSRAARTPRPAPLPTMRFL